VSPRGGSIYIKTEPSILSSLHSFSFWEQWANHIGFGPEFWHSLFVDESEHSGGFSNPELPNQARGHPNFLYK